MKKITSVLVALAMLLTMLTAMPVFAEADESFAGGTGTTDDPYLIADADDLKLARDMINADTAGTGARDAYYELTANIDLAGEQWIPIAPLSGYDFTGSFDGKNHVISNVSLHLTNANVAELFDVKTDIMPTLGFFGRIANGTVKNLGVDTVSIINDSQWVNDSKNIWNNRVNYMGGFAGWINNASVIENCYAKNVTVENNAIDHSAYAIGGFVGGMGNSTPSYTNCYVYNASLKSRCKGSGSSPQADSVGGFMGTKSSSTVNLTNCYAAKITTDAETTALTSFYGFLRSTGGTVNTTACYSEADDIAGARVAGAYNAAYTKGTIGMTKEGLVECMSTVGYVTDVAVNNGYPCFAWEIDPAEVWDGTAADSFAGGNGTDENPYQIATAAQLKLAEKTVNNRERDDIKYYFELLNDIDYEEKAWVPMGYSNSSGTSGFRGGFDGNGYVIKNLKIDETKGWRYCGFFGLIINATVKDLGIENFQLVHKNTSSEQFFNISGFAAEVRNNTKITNCYIKDSAIQQTSQWNNCEAYMSGFIGKADLRESADIEITNCYVEGLTLQAGVQIPLSAFFSGLSDITDSSMGTVTFTNCYVANVTNLKSQTTFYAFGFAGGNATTQKAFDTSKIILSNCYSTATTTEGTYAAGSTDVNWTLTDGIYKPDATSGNKWQLVAGTYFGEEGKTPAQVISAFNGVAGWKNGEDINNNELPALSWEPTPVISPYVVKAFSATKGTVTLTVNKPTEGDKVYVATYDSTGRLVSADVKDVAANITGINVSTAGVATVKVFIWNGITPVINAISKSL